MSPCLLKRWSFITRPLVFFESKFVNKPFRCGRTGRARSGRVYILATEGKEHQTLLDAMRQRDSLKPKILNSREVQESLYKLNPRLIPYDFTPRCEKIYVKVRKLPAKDSRKTLGGKQGSAKKDKKKRQTLPSTATTSNVNGCTSSTTTNEDNNDNIMPRLQLTNKATNSPRKEQSVASGLISSYLSPKKDGKKESNIPTLPSQSNSNMSPLKKGPKEKSKQPPGKSTKKNVDIRTLFLTANKPNQKRAELVNELKGETADMPTHLLDLFIHLKIACEVPKTCYICKIGCDCQILQKLSKNNQETIKFDGVPNFPDIDLISSFSADLLLKCAKPKAQIITVDSTQKENISLDLQEDSYYLEQWHDSDVTKDCTKNEAAITLRNSINFDIGDPDDIFADSPPQENKNAKQNDEIRPDIILPQSSVNFDLGSFDDILEESLANENDDQVQNVDKKESCADTAIIDVSLDDEPEPKEKNVILRTGSPSILSGTRSRAFKSPILTQKSPALKTQKSPILTTQKRSLKLKRSKQSHSSTPQSTAKKKLNLDSFNLSNSMLSITQTLGLINTCDDSVTSTKQSHDERRRSPILLTQADRSRRKPEKKTDETIIIDEDDDSDSIQNNSRLRNSISTVPNKRKIEDDVIASPYFNKKIKLDDHNQKDNKGLKDKIFSVLTSNSFKDNKRFPNDVIDLNCKTSVPQLSPEILKTENRLTKYSKLDPFELASKFSFCPKKSQQDKHEQEENRPNSFASEFSLPFKKSPQFVKTVRGHRTPKKKKTKNDFIDYEAELSDDCSGSGDELSDDSVGSIIDFITDKDVTHTEEDMQAHYLKSVKSPLKLGAFKIPELPKKFQNSILSQFVEPDSYEMDSFCVDSHIELTQSNDLSNLELAEMILENERRQKKKSRSKKYAQSQTEIHSPKIPATQDDSPKIKRKNGKKYNVISDSDDSN